MITKLSLTNFKSHEALSLDFTGGLNVIRGANEKGKSTLYEAISYALWGSRALNLSLEDTVTWGKPASSLAVELEFAVNGTAYKVRRSKSGAALSGGVVAEGHAAVTAAVETVLGASLQVGLATLAASQGALQNSLTSGALRLVEQLSRMDLIDTLINKVQTTLPSGATRQIDENIARLEAREPVAVVDFSEREAEVTQLKSQLITLEQEHSTLTEPLQVAEAAMTDATVRLARHTDQVRHSQKLEQQLAMAKAATPGEPPVCTVTESEDELQSTIFNTAAEQRKAAAYAWHQSVEWKQPTASVKDVEQAVAELENLVRTNSPKIAALHQEHAITKATGIWQDRCGLCNKDLTEVPEVVEVNAKVSAKLVEIEAEREKLLDASQAALAALAVWKAKFQDAAALEKAAAPFREFVEQVPGLPVSFNWIGGDVAEVSDVTAATRKLAELRAHVVALTKYERHCATLAANLRYAEEQVANHVVDAIDMSAVRNAGDTYSTLKAERERLREQMQSINTTANEKATQLRLAKQAYATAVAAYAESRNDLALLKTQREELLKHNALIKRLREVRPIVSARLWALLLSGVSDLFSQIRGTASRVGVADGGFTIDGKSASAYSGSTKDALGLAVRIMQQKTFLPNVGVMLLDEAGAAADAERECAMLSTVLAAGLDQVILVTHSDLADNFAANLIEL